MSYIDHLPVRFTIGHLQSVSSLMANILSANGYRKQSALRWLAGFHPISRLLRDYPQSNEIIQTLSQSLKYEPEELRGTTFHYLLQKFGVDGTLRTAAQFLKGSISIYLRYCGFCLGEHPWFLLPWRFLILEGCPKHSVPLLDRCSHCQSEIPLSSGLIFDARCPFCGKDLAIQSPLPTLTNRQQETAEINFRLLEFLITEQGFEHVANLPQYLGLQLKYLRKEKQLLAVSLAAKLNWTRNVITHIEIGSYSRCLSQYVHYCSFLGISLRELFDSALTTRWRKAEHRTTGELLSAIDTALQNLTEDGHLVSGQEIANFIGVSVDTLQLRKATNERLKAIRAAQSWTDEELLTKMDDAFHVLSQSRPYVTQQDIADYVGIGLATLQRRKATNERLKAIRAAQSWTDEELLTKMDDAFHVLSQSGHYVTQQDIANFIGVSVATLQRRKATNERLKAIRAAQSTDEELLTKMDDAFHVLSQSGHYVTQQDIADYVGIGLTTLKHRKATNERLKSITEAQRGK